MLAGSVTFCQSPGHASAAACAIAVIISFRETGRSTSDSRGAARSGGAMPRALARSVGERDCLRLHHQIERDAEAAAMFAVAAGIREEFVMAEV